MLEDLSKKVINKDIQKVAVGSVISYQGKEYKVEEIPQDEKGKYRIVPVEGGQAYTPSTSQLTKMFAYNEATLVMPETETLEPPPEITPEKIWGDEVDEIHRVIEPTSPGSVEVEEYGSIYNWEAMVRKYGQGAVERKQQAQKNEEKTRRIETLRQREDELKHQIEELMQQIWALPDEGDEEDEANLETSNVKTFSVELIKETIKSILKSQDVIKEVKNFKVSGKGTEMTFDATLVVKTNPFIPSFTVVVQAVFGNDSTEDNIVVKSHKVEALPGAKKLVESFIISKLDQNQIPKMLKDHIEREEGKKARVINIRAGKLAVIFKRVT